MALVRYSSGRLAMEAEMRTAVTVMDTPTASTLCQLAAQQRTVRYRGIQSHVHRP